MKNKIPLLLQLPEYYLIVLTIIGGYTPPFSINPFFVGILILLILQLVYKNKITGIILSTLFLLINLYMLGALISEFREFTSFTTDAQQLLVVGLTLWFFNMIAASTMIYRYATIHQKHTSQIVYE